MSRPVETLVLTATLLLTGCGRESRPASAMGPPSLEALVRQLGAVEFDARAQASEALLEAGLESPSDVIAFLAKHWTDSDTEVRLTCLTNPHDNVRIAALSIYPRLGGVDGVEAIKQCLGDPSKPVQDAAVEALAELRSESAVPLLVARLAEDDFHAECALRSISSPSAVPLLRKLLDVENPQIRMRAIRALCCCGTKSAASHIALLLEDPSPQIQNCAAWALEQLSGEKWEQTSEARIRAARLWWKAHQGDPEYQ